MDATTESSPRIAFEARGQGDVTLLFLPGWCGGRSVFDATVEQASQHRRVASLDWRGHGASPAAAEDFGIAEMVSDARDVITQLGADRVVPVALSHAGWVAIEMRRQLGEAQVPAIVLLDWMVLGTPPGFAEALAGLQSPAWEDVRAALFAMWTGGVADARVHRYVEEMATYGPDMWSRAAREIASSFETHPSPLSALAEMTPACPALHVYAQPRDDAFLAAQQAFADGHAWFEVHRLDAQSHFPMLEAPGAVAAVIDDFVTRRLG